MKQTNNKTFIEGVLAGVLVSLSLFAVLYYANAMGGTFDKTRLPAYSVNYDRKSDAKSALLLAVTNAKKTNKPILLIAGGDWCKWSGTLDNFLESHAEIEKRLYTEFEVLKIFYGKNMTVKSKEFFKMFPKHMGSPHFYVLDSHGAFKKSIATRTLERGYSYSRAKFIAFLDTYGKQ